MPKNAKVAAIQMASGPSVDSNLLEASQLIAEAVRADADIVVLPENFAFMCAEHKELLSCREPAGDGPIQSFLSEQARRHGIWLVGGTIPLAADDPAKVRAACLIYDGTGLCVSRYDKMHLFDVHLVDSGERYTESLTIEQGDKVVVIETPWGRLGVSVGYDLRFPELFRSMLQQGVELLVVPAQFTIVTGKAHWETLLRARAIENLCYVVAAAQGGFHLGGCKTHGDSMIVDPWGVVLERLPRGSGFVLTEVERERLEGIRRNFPTIEHRRLSCG
jgi:nitrilase